MDHAFRAVVKRNLRRDLRHLPVLSLLESHGSPLLLLDPRKVERQYRELQKELPFVDHHYAIKASMHPAVVAAVDACGGFFDLMGTSDIDMVFDQRISPERCIHTNPVHEISDIAYAYEHGLRTFVVDSGVEVDKFKAYARCRGLDRVQLLVRLAFPNPQAASDVSFKFGVPPAKAAQLVAYARAQGLDVAGFTLHVGSQTLGTEPFVKAIRATTALIERVEREQGFQMTMLDIGGGFPVSYLEPATELAAIAAAITPLLAPLAARMRILSEPGRFVVASSTILISKIVSHTERDGKRWGYINEGTYKTFSSEKYEGVVQPTFALKELEAERELELFPWTLGGASCDGGDVLPREFLLPEMREGDLLVSSMMGAYTWVSSTDFHGIRRTPIVVVGQDRLPTVADRALRDGAGRSAAAAIPTAAR